MENQKNTNDQGIRLLKKVIETNEANISENIALRFEFESLSNLLGLTESIIARARTVIKQGEEFSELESEKRLEFINAIPNSIDARLSLESLKKMDDIQNKFKTNKFINLITLGCLAISLITILLTSFLASKWYKESVKTKTEIRNEIFRKMTTNDQLIYDKNEIEKLQEQSNLINLWIKGNPKNAQDFLRFRDGYQAKK